jgi:hypothetical protein
MTARRHTPAHDYWHRRVEGQIRHTIGQHPEWFRFKDAHERKKLVNSLAKRIVGEIVAGYGLAPMPDGVAVNCALPAPGGGELSCQPHSRGVLPLCAPAVGKSE